MRGVREALPMASTLQNAGGYVRHPPDIPLRTRTIPRELSAAPRPLPSRTRFGLQFEAQRPPRAGDTLEITVEIDGETLDFRGVVHWIRPLGRRFEVGLCCQGDEQAFRARMAEQACHIAAFRTRESRRTGCALSIEQAARAWVERHAAQFLALACSTAD